MRALVAIEIMSTAAILAVLAAPTMVAFCLLPLAGLVLQGSSTITYGTVGDLVDERHQSRGFAFFYTLSGVAFTVGPTGCGLVSDGPGPSPAMVAMAIVVGFPPRSPSSFAVHCARSGSPGTHGLTLPPPVSRDRGTGVRPAGPGSGFPGNGKRVDWRVFA